MENYDSMKIAMITTFQHPCTPELGWGAEKYIWDLASCLDNSGHEVTIFGIDGSHYPPKGRLCKCNSEKEAIDFIKENRNLFKYDWFDIIHDWSSTKTVHDYCQENNIKSIASNFNTHFLYPTIHQNIVCVSDRQRYLGLQGRSGFEGTRWEKQVGYTGHLHDAITINLGIDLRKYTPVYDKENYVLHFNSFDYFKGIDITLQIAEKLPHIKFKIAGSTTYEPHKKVFEEFKPVMDSLDNVKYYTDISNEEKIKLFQKAKMYIFPSQFEQPFAVVCIESLACGTPVITMNHGAFPEMIHHGETGFLCNNFSEMIPYIDILYNNIDKKVYKNCRFDAEMRFSRTRMAKSYENTYNSVIKGKWW